MVRKTVDLSPVQPTNACRRLSIRVSVIRHTRRIVLRAIQVLSNRPLQAATDDSASVPRSRLNTTQMWDPTKPDLQLERI
jgi:hypothetical protein